MEKKMTQKEALNIAIEVVNASTHDNRAEVIEKLKNMIDILEKKASASKKRAEKRDEEKQKLAAVILEALKAEADKITMTELFANHEEKFLNAGITSPQKARAVIKPLIEEGIILNIKDKSKSYFTV